jgi:hypothetical protein
MEISIGEVFSNDLKGPWIGKNNSISSHSSDLFYRLFKDLDVMVSWKDIHREQSFLAIGMNHINRFFEFIKTDNLILSHSQ